SVITKKFAKANNKQMDVGYDKSLNSSYIKYLDANNLYGWSMIQYLPYGGFKWLNEEEINQLNIQDIPSDGDVGYFLEVDLEYPTELHDLHNDYPLAPEKMVVQYDDLSQYTKNLMKDHKVPVDKTAKLIANLNDK